MTSMGAQRMIVVTHWTALLLACAMSMLVAVMLFHLDMTFGFKMPMPLLIIGQTFLWIVVSAMIMSFVEHQVHARLMHRPNFLSKRYASYKRVFEAHAITHHAHYSKIFTDEPVAPGEDKEIRLTVRKAPMKAMPFAALLSFLSIQAGLTFVAIVTFHHWIWNNIHLEMHKPENRFFSEWPVYKFLARHHYLHHRYQNKNFNVVFPFADYLLGTNVHATKQDKEEMVALGLY